jgi:predicted DNA-binding protein with PD1-like motif
MKYQNQMSVEKEAGEEAGDGLPHDATRGLFASAGRSRPLQLVRLAVFLSLIATGVSIISVGVAFERTGSSNAPLTFSSLRVFPLRLLPGDDVVSGIMRHVNAHQLKSAWISTGVGSLTHYNIRFANRPDGSSGDGHFEIVSLVGTMTSLNISNMTSARPLTGAWHLHISIGDGNGTTISGHLLVNSTVFTTLELTILADCSKVFFRADDGSTGWDELQIVNETWC